MVCTYFAEIGLPWEGRHVILTQLDFPSFGNSVKLHELEMTEKHHIFKPSWSLQWIMSRWNLHWLVCSGFLLPNTSYMQERHINWILIEQCASNFQNPEVYKMEDARLLLCGIGSQRHGAQGLTLKQFGSWYKHFTGPGEEQLFGFSGLHWRQTKAAWEDSTNRKHKRVKKISPAPWLLKTAKHSCILYIVNHPFPLQINNLILTCLLQTRYLGW